MDFLFVIDAPDSLKATYFAVMASFTNLALSASQLGTKYLNGIFTVTREVRDKMLRIAGHLLEAHPDDLVLEEGRVSVRGAGDKGLSIKAVAQAAVGRGLPPDEAPGLEGIHFFKAPKMSYTNGAHLVVVEVDPETLAVRILKYVIAHDCGRMINPVIVDGQIQGGLACGVGNALLEVCAAVAPKVGCICACSETTCEQAGRRQGA